MKKRRLFFVISTVLILCLLTINVAFADWGQGQPEAFVTKIIHVVFPLLRAAGFIILVWSIGKLIISVQFFERQDDKITCIMQVILGICLIFSQQLLSGVLTAAGYTGTL